MIFYKEGFDLKLNYDYVRAIPEYRMIIEADRGVGIVGDHEGRKKYFATMVLNYIFFCCEFTDKNPLWNVPFEERHELALKEAGFDKSVAGKYSSVTKTFLGDLEDYVEKAKNRYLETQISLVPAIQSTINITEGLKISNRIVSNLLSRLTKKLNVLEQNSADTNISESEVNSCNSMIATLLANASSIKKAQKDIDDLKDLIQKQINQTETAKGGREVGNRANADKYVKKKLYVPDEFKDDEQN